MSFTKTASLTAIEDRYTLHGPLGSLVLASLRNYPSVTLTIHRRDGPFPPTYERCEVLAEAKHAGPCWTDIARSDYTEAHYSPLVAYADEADIWSALEADYYRLIEHLARE